MKLAQLSFSQFNQKIKSSGISIKVGAFNVNLQTKIPLIINNFYFLYQDFTLLDDGDFIDYHLQLKRPFSLRYWIKPQVDFYMDGNRPFKPLPLDQSMAFFEWGFNWAIAQYAHQFYIIHAAVVEKNGKAIILPGIPGAGKSTLCAALVHHGWRLLSDEQALVQDDAKTLHPIARPINLKNRSVDVIKGFCPNAEFGDLFTDTNKGDISHAKPPTASVEKIDALAKASYIIFPSYSAKAIDAQLIPEEKGSGLIQLIDHSFNYTTLGKKGFKIASELVTHCDVYKFHYHRLEEAMALFNALVEE